MRAIAQEANAASEIKRDLPIMVVLGNRPDLRGNAKRRERPPNGGADGNVFDIQQGVAVHRADLWGTRESKYESLLTPIMRRPFNMRHAYCDDPLIALRRHSVMRHMLAGTNLGLVFDAASGAG